jgi:hypothetical protein
MQQRRRSKPHSFVDQLEAEKARITARLKTARGPKRDELIQKISQIETAIQVNDWLSSPVLKCPSSDNLRPIRRSAKGGSGSSGVRV